MRTTLTITVDIDGDNPDAAARKIGELLPDVNGLFAAGVAAVIVRRLCQTGLAGGYPNGWRIGSVEVTS